MKNLYQSRRTQKSILVLERNYTGVRMFGVVDNQVTLRALKYCEVNSGLVLDRVGRLNKLGTSSIVKLIRTT